MSGQVPGPALVAKKRRKLMKWILIGQRGSGKSTLGKILASKWQCPFQDLDELVENHSGKSPRHWIQEGREIIFRHWENQLLCHWIKKEEGILATGAGAPLFPSLLETLKNIKTVIWLKNSVESRVNILRKNPRPPLTTYCLEDEIRALDERRNPIYRYVSEVSVDTDASEEDLLARFESLRRRF
jgi:shikimate kinase